MLQSVMMNIEVSVINATTKTIGNQIQACLFTIICVRISIGVLQARGRRRATAPRFP